MTEIAIFIIQIYLIARYFTGLIANVLKILSTDGNEQFYWVVRFMVTKPFWLSILIWGGVFNFG